MAIKHAFVSEIEDGEDEALVRPSDWNADHIGTYEAFPIGSVFLAIVNTNPNTLLGYGTWSQIASGKFLVGQDSGDADFDTAEETGGAKTHTHTNHPATATSQADVGATARGSTTSTLTLKAHTHNTPVLSHNTPSHLPPYFVVYVWKRTA